MRIDVRMDALPLILTLRNGERRLAYAAVKAINATAKKIQEAQQARLRREFEVRKRQFMERQVAIIKPFANVKQGRAFAEVAVGDRKRLLLERFETGGLREPFKGKRVAVPVTGGPARPDFKKSVPAAFMFTGLRLRRTKGRGKATRSVKFAQKAGQWKGEHRTFILERTEKHPEGGVYQRIGPGRDDIRMVYSFAPPMRLRARLRWMRTAKAVADQWFHEFFEREAAQAVAHARGRTG